MFELSSGSDLGQLMARLPRAGQVRWIGLRPARGVAMRQCTQAQAIAGAGLIGDRYNSASGKRGVTLVQAEHLPAIAALSGYDQVSPALLRRNLVVAGIALIALKGRKFRIGEVLLEGTGPCDPCSRMEDALGPGGYNAMRGHGGLTARILESGTIHIGDQVTAQ